MLNGDSMIDEILEIIKESFDAEIYTTTYDSFFGIGSSIEGKEEFLQSIQEKLKSLLDEKSR